MYFDLFYIQCHHLAKKDLWNEIYMNMNMNVELLLGLRLWVRQSKFANPHHIYLLMICVTSSDFYGDSFTLYFTNHIYTHVNIPRLNIDV
jgi:hypothetical protein